MLDAMGVRVDELVRRLNNVEDELRANRPAVLANQILENGKDIEGCSGELRALRRTVIAFAMTVAASCVGFSITVILVWGGH